MLGTMRAWASRTSTDVGVFIAQGAGAGIDHDFFHALDEALAVYDVGMMCAEFALWTSSRRVPPARAAMAELADAYRAARSLQPGMRLALGGKSFGGRMASHVVDDVGAPSLCCLGFPLHQPKVPGVARAQHLAGVQTRSLFVSGDRDAMAEPTLLSDVVGRMARATVHWVRGADHGFNVRKKDGRAVDDVIAEVACTIAACVR